MKVKNEDYKKKFSYIEDPKNKAEITSLNIDKYRDDVIRYAQQLKYQHESKNTSDKPYHTDDEYLEFAQKYFNINRFKSYVSMMRMVYNPSEPVPNPEWSGYSYIEILNMSNNGVYVPKDVLYWAKAQEESDVTAYQVISDEAENDNNTSTQSVSADFDINNLAVNVKENIVKAAKQQEKSENDVDALSPAIISFQNLQRKFNDKFSKTDFDQKSDRLKELEQKSQIGELSENETQEFKNLKNELQNSKEDIYDIVKNNEYLEDFMRSIDKVRLSNSESEKISDEAIFSALELSKSEEKFSSTANRTHNVNNMRLIRGDNLLNVAGSIPVDFVPQLGIEKGKELDILINSVDELLNNTTEIVNLNAFDTEIPNNIGDQNYEAESSVENKDESEINNIEENTVPLEIENPEENETEITEENDLKNIQEPIIPETNQSDINEIPAGNLTSSNEQVPENIDENTLNNQTELDVLVAETNLENNIGEENQTENNQTMLSEENNIQSVNKPQKETENIQINDDFSTNTEKEPESEPASAYKSEQVDNTTKTINQNETASVKANENKDISAGETEEAKAKNESVKAEYTVNELISEQALPQVNLNENKSDADISNQRIKTLETYITKIAEKIENNKTVAASDVKAVSEVSAQAPDIAEMSENLNNDGKKFAYNLASKFTQAEEAETIGKEFATAGESFESAPNKVKNTAVRAKNENSSAKAITLTSDNMSKDLESSLNTINSTANEIDIKYGNNTDVTDEKRETQNEKEEILEIIDEKEAKADNQLNQIVEIHDTQKPDLNATIIASVATYANIKSDSDDDTKAERRLTKFNRDGSINLRKKNKKVVAVSASTGGSVK